MIIRKVRVLEDFATDGYRIIIRGGEEPGGPSFYMSSTGEWVRISEGQILAPNEIGFPLPEGVLEEIVREYLKIATPDQSTERHLEDAIEVRNRLLAMVEKRR